MFLCTFLTLPPGGIIQLCTRIVHTHGVALKVQYSQKPFYFLCWKRSQCYVVL